MNYENKTKIELIELLNKKDVQIELLNKKIDNKKTVGRKKYNDESTIRLMYDMYTSNNSIGSIANLLNASNIPAPNSKIWNRSTIYYILNNKENINKYLNTEMYKKFIEHKKSGRKD